MKYRVEITPVARAELVAESDYFERNKKGEGKAFAAEVRSRLKRIAFNPKLHAIVFLDVRKAVLKKYSFCLFYYIEGNRIVVISVFHTSRDPAIWQSRR